MMVVVILGAAVGGFLIIAKCSNTGVRCHDAVGNNCKQSWVERRRWSRGRGRAGEKSLRVLWEACGRSRHRGVISCLGVSCQPVSPPVACRQQSSHQPRPHRSSGGNCSSSSLKAAVLSNSSRQSNSISSLTGTV